MSGGAASASKGTIYERELVTAVRDLGFGALRCPTSGSATDEDLPDVLVGQGLSVVDSWRETGNGLEVGEVTNASDAWALELKCGDSTTLYVEPQEVEALENFSSRFGAKAFLGARFTTRGSPTKHYLVEPANARMTDAGRYGLPLSSVEDRASIVVRPGDDPSVEVRDV